MDGAREAVKNRPKFSLHLAPSFSSFSMNGIVQSAAFSVLYFLSSSIEGFSYPNRLILPFSLLSSRAEDSLVRLFIGLSTPPA